MNIKETTMKKLMEQYKSYLLKVAEKELPKLKEELGLKELPKISFETKEEDSVMYVKHETYVKGDLFYKTIEKTVPYYEIHVNLKALTKECVINKLTLGSSSVDYDNITFLLAHECRHLWQAQGDYWVGKTKSFYIPNNLYKSHGDLPEEKDANNFAIGYCKGNAKKLAELLTKRQENTSLFSEFSDAGELKKITFDTIKKYNKTLYRVLKVLTK